MSQVSGLASDVERITYQRRASRTGTTDGHVDRASRSAVENFAPSEDYFARVPEAARHRSCDATRTHLDNRGRARNIPRVGWPRLYRLDRLLGQLVARA